MSGAGAPGKQPLKQGAKKGSSSSSSSSIDALEAQNKRMDERLAQLRAQLSNDKEKWQQIVNNKSGDGSFWRSAKPVPPGNKKCTLDIYSLLSYFFLYWSSCFMSLYVCNILNVDFVDNCFLSIVFVFHRWLSKC